MHGPDLTSLYIQACRPEPATPQIVELWRLPVMRLGAVDLLVMAQWMRDPFPWKPFLVMLERFYDEGYDTRPMIQHVWDRAQELLDIQGLGLLRPGDVMGYPIRIREAIGTISS